MKCSALILVAIVVLVGVGLAVGFNQEIERLGYQRSLFTGASQHENFVRQDALYPINDMPAAIDPYVFPRGAVMSLPEEFAHQQRRFSTQDFLATTDTGALLLLHDGQIRYEKYWLTGGPAVAWLTHSVSKSLVASAVAIALQEGLIESLDDPIDTYVPKLANGGYKDVAIRDVLQMSSGIRWNEDYADPDSDLNQFGKILFAGDSYDDFVASRVAERRAGEYNNYKGVDSQALTMLVRSASGMSLANFLSQKIWAPMGMQDRGFWTTDDTGVELGLGGLSASARDLAKIGELYRNLGAWQGQQILDPSWIQAATTVTEPHLARGVNPQSKHAMGYGYQWWLPDGDDQDYSAIGIYNQFVYVNPRQRTVIVKLSAHRDYANPEAEHPYLEAETFSLFRTLAQRLESSSTSHSVKVRNPK